MCIEQDRDGKVFSRPGKNDLGTVHFSAEHSKSYIPFLEHLIAGEEFSDERYKTINEKDDQLIESIRRELLENKKEGKIK